MDQIQKHGGGSAIIFFWTSSKTRGKVNIGGKLLFIGTVAEVFSLVLLLARRSSLDVLLTFFSR